jgi:hypothetical protein
MVSDSFTQLTATVTFVDGTSKNVTAEAIWRSFRADVAVVSAGKVIAVGPGSAEIQATYQNYSENITVTVR